jgi:hypothetical protein
MYLSSLKHVQRFKEKKLVPGMTRDQEAAIQLNKDIAPFLNKPSSSSSPIARSLSPNNRGGTRPKFSSNFAPSNEERFRPVKTPPGPPPGAYNTNPTWKSGTILMAPSMVESKKKPDISPGFVIILFIIFTFIY